MLHAPSATWKTYSPGVPSACLRSFASAAFTFAFTPATYCKEFRRTEGVYQRANEKVCACTRQGPVASLERGGKTALPILTCWMSFWVLSYPMMCTATAPLTPTTATMKKRPLPRLALFVDATALLATGVATPVLASAALGVIATGGAEAVFAEATTAGEAAGRRLETVLYTVFATSLTLFNTSTGTFSSSLQQDGQNGQNAEDKA